MFADNPEWHRLLHVPKVLDSSSWTSLLLWFDCHKIKVQEVHTDSPQATSALTAPAELRSVCPTERGHLFKTGKDCFLSTFTALTTCSLNVSSFYGHAGPDAINCVLDLGLLKSLPYLKALELTGRGVACSLDTLQHLTKLVILDADVSAESDCPFVASLKCREVHKGQLAGMHPNGVAACQQLRQLRCKSAAIVALADMDTLSTDVYATHIPDLMTSLTALESLQLGVSVSASLESNDKLDLEWLCHFTNLRRLGLDAEHAYTIPASMSRLTKLEQLHLTFESDHDSSIDLDWQALGSLKQGWFIGGKCQFDQRLQELAKVHVLRDVYMQIDTDHPEVDDHSWASFVDLAFDMLADPSSQCTLHVGNHEGQSTEVGLQTLLQWYMTLTGPPRDFRNAHPHARATPQ